MSKATDAADVDTSVTTEEPSATTEPSVEPQGTARALTVETSGNRDPLYGTDRAMARRLIEKAEYHEYTDIKKVIVERYGETLNVRLDGVVCLSYSDVVRATAGTYEPSDLLSHSSGSVTVTLTTR